jgi:hypothetical protein
MAKPLEAAGIGQQNEPGHKPSEQQEFDFHAKNKAIISPKPDHQQAVIANRRPE